MNSRTALEQTDKLRAVGLRPTRQRLALAMLLFGKEDRHITAEELHKEAAEAGATVSLATIYNTLHQFTGAGLLRELSIDGTRTYFDTNTSNHHHFYCEDDGVLAALGVAGDVVVLSSHGVMLNADGCYMVMPKDGDPWRIVRRRHPGDVQNS